MSGEIIQRTADAMVREILSSPHKGRPAKTIFFGGGTPTFFSESQLLSIFEAVKEVHPPLPDAEITSEANPGTADAELFTAMRKAGFNRLSMGAQSFQNSDLLRLGRVHNSNEIVRAFQIAREAGFTNVNLDLMFALPGQNLSRWKENLETAIDLKPNHLSLYCLTLEPNTSFYREALRGLLVQPDDDQQVAMYELAVETAEENGYRNYEISNFAQEARECAHNLATWRGEEYAGYGPGAVGAVDMGDGNRLRATKLKQPVRYCDAVETGGKLTVEEEVLTPETLRVEKVMLGIRLTEGVDASLVNPSGLEKCLNLGWVEQVNDRVRLTRQGKHFCTEVSVELI